MRPMSERGSLATDGPTACPFVAFEDDRDLRSRAPDRRHRCYAEPVPAPRAIAHQEHYCLGPAFPGCPTFVDWARREAARPGDAARQSRPSRVEASPSASDAEDLAGDWRPSRPTPGQDRDAGATVDAVAEGGRRRAPRPQSRAVPRLRDEPRDSGLWGSDEVDESRQRDWAAPPPWLAVRAGAEDDRDHVRGARPVPDAGEPDEGAPAGRDGDGDGDRGQDWIPAAHAPRGEGAPGAATGARDGRHVDPVASAGGELARQLDSVAMPGDLSLARDQGDRPQEGGRGHRLRPSPDDAAWRDVPAPSADEGRLARQEPHAERPVAPTRPSRPVARSAAGPAVAQARPAVGGRVPRDPSAPAWERPRRLEAYPSLRTRVGLPDVPRLAIYALALLAAALVLFLAPTFLSGGSSPGSVASPTATGSPSASVAPRTPAAPTPLVYTVAEGDTLSGIAARFGLTMEQLVKANPQIKNPDRLGIGDELTIPARTPSKPVPVGPAASGSPGASDGAAP